MPNPMVGAVITYKQEIIGEGYHQAYGGPHAEVHAIRAVRDPALLKESTLFVTLEPCSHFGKTPPCADLIIESGIPHVVVGCRDPFSEVSGRGITKLRSAGIQVTELLSDECVLLNRRFILAHRERRPYIILKWAQSADGYIASTDPRLGWFTSERSRALVHQWRAEEMAILVGTKTVLVDNPSLTVRYGYDTEGETQTRRNPLRVTVDRAGALKPDLQIFKPDAETLVFGAAPIGAGPHIQSVCIDPSKPLETQICQNLYERRVLSLIVEGGAKTLRGFLELGLWDEARIFQAPERFGSGMKAPTWPSAHQALVSSGVDTVTTMVNPELPLRLGIDMPIQEMLKYVSSRSLQAPTA